MNELQAVRDPKLSKALRPNNLSEFVGQERAVEVIKAMTGRSGVLSDSLLFVGAPGLGKTSLAQLTTKAQLQAHIGGQIDRSSDIMFAFQGCKTGDTVFIDEIHSMRKEPSESLYNILEDGFINTYEGRKELGDIPFVAATTEPGKLPRPLYERFGHVVHLDYYSQDEIEKILSRSSQLLKLNISKDEIEDIAARSRGVPRVANKLLKRARDFASGSTISKDVLSRVWSALQIDPLGLDSMDRKMLDFLSQRERPAGLRTVAQAIGIDPTGVETMIEPFLIRSGLIEIGPGGRALTTKGLLHSLNANSG